MCPSSKLRRQLCARDLSNADDTCFVSPSDVDLQTMLDRFAAAFASFGHSINVKKTDVLHQPAPGTPYTAPTILLNGMPLNLATTFKYLGSTIANDCSLDKEPSARILTASAAFGRLRERLWNKHNIKLVKMQGLQRHSRCIDVIFSDCHRYTYATYEPSWETGGQTG